MREEQEPSGRTCTEVTQAKSQQRVEPFLEDSEGTRGFRCVNANLQVKTVKIGRVVPYGDLRVAGPM